MFVSPFSAPGLWLRGNLHGHTTESDGRFTPAQYAAAYRARGYDFAAVTDHGKITDMGAFADRDFAWVSGVELDGPEPAPFGHHVVALGLDGLPPRGSRAGLQATVDAIRARGGLAIVAHPYETGLTSAQLLAADGYLGIEVWNTLSVVGWGKGVATVQWDEMLQAGRLVAGLATDDTHQREGRADDLGRGWVVVRATERTPGAILRALAAGCFYASTGPRIHDFRVERGADGVCTASARCSPCRYVHFLCDRGLGRTAAAQDGGEIGEAQWRLHPSATYVRLQCVDAVGGTAWSHPVAL